MKTAIRTRLATTALLAILGLAGSMLAHVASHALPAHGHG